MQKNKWSELKKDLLKMIFVSLIVFVFTSLYVFFVGVPMTKNAFGV